VLCLFGELRDQLDLRARFTIDYGRFFNVGRASKGGRLNCQDIASCIASVSVFQRTKEAGGVVKDKIANNNWSLISSVEANFQTTIGNLRD
jgi:hypothetical protein